MLGLGLGLNKNAFINNNFTLPTALHQWNYQKTSIVGTTMTATDFGSIGGYSLTNPDLASLPTLNSNSIGFDGVSQILTKDTANFRNADTTGCFHFKFYAIDGQNQFLFSMTDGTASNGYIFFQKRDTNTFRVVTNNYGVFNGVILETLANSVTTGLNTCSIYHNGVRALVLLNGVKIQPGDYATDYLSQYWIKRYHDSGGSITNISMGGLYNTSSTYSQENIKYIAYEPYGTEGSMLANHDLIRNTDF